MCLRNLLQVAKNNENVTTLFWQILHFCQNSMTTMPPFISFELFLAVERTGSVADLCQQAIHNRRNRLRFAVQHERVWSGGAFPLTPIHITERGSLLHTHTHTPSWNSVYTTVFMIDNSSEPDSTWNHDADMMVFTLSWQIWILRCVCAFCWGNSSNHSGDYAIYSVYRVCYTPRLLHPSLTDGTDISRR